LLPGNDHGLWSLDRQLTTSGAWQLTDIGARHLTAIGARHLTAIGARHLTAIEARLDHVVALKGQNIIS
jgi:hypothetical protein